MYFLRILKIDLAHLRSNGHFQFFTALARMLGKSEAILLKIQHLFDIFMALFATEDEALKKIRKSPLTDEIRAADRGRDRVFRGMNDANRSALNHYDPKMETAARRLQVVLDAYGNVNKLSIAEKTSAICNLVNELKDNYSDDAVTVGLDAWADELLCRNSALDKLMSHRFHESAGRPDVQMRTIRAKVDEVYRAITFCIEALWLMAPTDEDKEPYADFIRQWNAVVEYYNNTQMHRSRADRGNAATPPDAAGAPDDAPTPNDADENPDGE